MIEKIKTILAKEKIEDDEILNTFSLEERLILTAGVLAYDIDSMEGSQYIYEFMERSDEEGWTLLRSKEALEFLLERDDPDMDTLLYTFKKFMFAKDIYTFLEQRGFERSYIFSVFSELDDDEVIKNIIEKIDSKDRIKKDLEEHLINQIEDVDLKIQLMRKYLKKDQFARIIASLEKDEDKVKYLNLVSFRDRTDVITCIESDEIKEGYIRVYDPNRSHIIASLKSDQKIEHYLNKLSPVLTSVERARIIASFQSLELIKKYYNTITNENAILTFIEINKDEEEVLPICNKLAQKIKKEKNIVWALQSIKDEFTRYTLIKRLRTEKYIQYFLDLEKVTIKDINQLMVTANDRILDLIFQTRLATSLPPEVLFGIISNFNDANRIFQIMGHIESFPEYKESYRKIIEIYAQKYSVNLDHLIALLKITDMSLLASLGNNNIQNIINLDEDSFKKFINIFNSSSFEVTDVANNAILNALIQKEFDLKHREIIQYSTTLENALYLGLKTKDFTKLETLIEKMLEVIDINEFEVTKETFLEGLKNNDETMKDKMRAMAHKYLIYKKNEFLTRELPKARRKASLATYEKNAYIKYYLKNKRLWEIIYHLEDKLEENPTLFNKEEKELINNKEALKSIINFHKNPQYHSEELKNVKQYNKLFYSILEKSLDRKVKDHLIPNLPIKYEIVKTKEKDLVGILTSIRADQLKKTLFEDEEAIKELITFLEKYKILGWCNRYEEIAEKADLSFTTDSIAELINNYPLIIKALKKQAEKENKPFSPTLIKIMDEASAFDTYSSKYALLFGKENFRLIKTNPGRFKGSWTKEKRIAKSLELIKEMYKKDAIPVPSIDKEYTTSTNKNVHVVLGNTTDLINLTLGERTDACMRLGSAGDRLYRYALLDNKGFHICLYHPKTGEFISRLSCFRSGNTVVFNQLRHSVSSQYSDEELIEIIKQVADELIELTRNSSSPIDNILIDGRYGMEKSNMRSIPLGIDIREKAKITPYFSQEELKDIDEKIIYSDVTEYGIVLSSSRPDKKLVPINLSAPVPKYAPCRSKIKVYHNRQAQDQVLHYKLLEGVINGAKLDNIDATINEGIKTCITGEDWYIAIDQNGKIEQYIIKGIRDVSLATQEMKIVLETYKDRLETLTEEDVIKMVA